MTRTMRLTIPIALLLMLLAAYLLYHPGSARLLTPVPTGAFPVIFILATALGIGCGIALLGDIQSRLLRRLGTIAILMLCFYLSGETARGIFAARAFSHPDQLTRASSHWMVVGVRADGVSAIIQGRAGPPRRFPVDPATLALARPGACFTAAIERSPEGAERLPPDQAPLTAADFSC